MTEQFDDQGLFRKGIRFQGVARGVRLDEETGRLVPKSWFAPSRGVFNALLIGLAFWAGIAIAYYGLVFFAVLRGTR